MDSAMSSAMSTVGKTNQPTRTASAPEQVLMPSVDITESASGITLVADLPGVTRDGLGIKVEGDSLVIDGRVYLDMPANIEVLHSEMRSAHFRRSFTLSRDLDADKIEATLRNGVLSLQIPKSQTARPRRIEVKVLQ